MTATQSLPAAAQQRRQGPRPLQVHLAMALSTWLMSRAAWPIWSNGSASWSNEEAVAALKQALAKVDPDAFAAALDSEVRARTLRLLRAVEAYQAHPYRRSLKDPPALWREGTTRLLDYGVEAAEAPTLLVVPSLINRGYVLDLSEDCSLLRFLATQGFRPLLVDWDRPGDVERGFTLTDYIAGRLDGCLDAALSHAKGPVFAVGYCMGGLLALGLALRRQRDLAGLVLMATPWDFHAGQAVQARFLGDLALPLGLLMDGLGELPVDNIQLLFAMMDPALVVRKFLAFERLSSDDPKAAAFVALEDWLNDGVPLAAPVARECLTGWYGHNTTANGEWRLAGRPVDPRQLDLPALSIIPEADRIVPPQSAQALADLLPRGEVMAPPLGHIGMVVSSRARDELWAPLAKWLQKMA